MQLNLERAVSVFRKVRQIREELKQYSLADGRHDIPEREYLRVISQMYKMSIKSQEAPIEGTFLRGMVLRYADSALILIKKNMEKDWQRFTVIKEASHIVIDEKEDWSTDAASTIRNLLMEYRVHEERVAKPIVQSEVFAEFSALELLYPHVDRIADRDKINSGDLTLSQIAGRYNIPEVFCAQAISDWYHELATDVWGKPTLHSAATARESKTAGYRSSVPAEFVKLFPAGLPASDALTRPSKDMRIMHTPVGPSLSA